jgi:hypothetical protein
MFNLQNTSENGPFLAKILCSEIVIPTFNWIFLNKFKGSHQNLGVFQKALGISFNIDVLKKSFGPEIIALEASF